MAPRSIFIALAGGALVYGGVLALGSPQKQPQVAALVATVTLTPSKNVTAKTSDKKVTLPVSPSMSPTLAPKVSVTPTPTLAVASPTPWPTPTHTPDGSTSSPLPSVAPTPATASRVVINEIAWTGTATSSNDEWVELYNAGDGVADLTGWRLRSDDGKPDIALSGSILAGQYYLIERTDDNVVSDIMADMIAPFGTGLGNPGENLKLLDPAGGVVDQADCAVGWFAGDNATKSSMERKSPLAPGNDPQNWATNNGIIMVGADAAGLAIHGTPKYANSALTL